MTTSVFPSLIDELVDDLIRDHLLPPDKALNLNRETKVATLPSISSTLHNHQWTHEARNDQHST